MDPKPKTKLLWRGALELMFWAALTSGFLWRYLQIVAAPYDVAWEHLRIFGVGVLALLLLRAVVAKLPSNRSRRMGQGLLTLGFLIFWGGFYTLILVGLHYWGEVVTLDILKVYLGQSDTLLSTLGVSPMVLLLIFGVMFAISFAGCAAIHQNHWIEGFMNQRARSHFIVPLLGILCIVVIEGFSFQMRLELPSKEPLNQVLRARRQGGDGQVLEVGGAERAQKQQAAADAREQYVPATSPLKANVILIVVDALRDDHLSINGYVRPTTPRLQNWLAQSGGITLGRARASCASSVCGITSIISSTFSHQQTEGGMTLQEVLAKNGWQTHLALSGDHTNFYGLRQRYGPVDSYVDGSQVSPAMLNDDRFVLEAVRSLTSKMQEPSLLHLHLKSSHILGRRFLQPGIFGPSANYSNPLFKMNADYKQRAVNYYDEGVLQADHVIDQALLELKKTGFLNRALVVITGDHGEHLGEHGRFSHANGILEPVVRIPWIMLPFGIDFPTLEMRRRRHQVDIAPTVLDLLHVPVPLGWSGVSLLKKNRSPNFSYLRQGSEVGLIDHRDSVAEYKYSIEPPSNVGRVVDLSSDPSEESEVSVSPDLLQEWHDLLMPQMLSMVRSKR